ncbi:TlpA family protein disulfide reductase [Ramlibacter sp. RBP-2]|uniref:TlpA family protein disulfide reductase n=1 Tax=Ramlibacter lithotrophicus TaxID=2606681 RepID=A0A7X6I8G8_9BURK|nr:TlpA disulfide reductase family protein [Ramlibacter lithotrophicus]NKE68274.1 TlpA family protein disulfide reductase [Ramlibacter lithotrophicus]
MRRVLYGLAAAAALAVGGAMHLGSASAAAPTSTFVLLDGTSRTTADLKGQVTLVTFWATSCTACVAAMPQVAAIHDKYRGAAFDTIAVAMSHDLPGHVAHYSESRQLPFKVALDSTGAVARAWGDVRQTPTTYLVNRRGEIVKRFQGPVDADEVQRLIERLLAQA